MDTVNDLFHKSIDNYTQLIEKTNALNSNMAKLFPEEILQQCEELHDLQKNQAVIDKFIIEIMIDAGSEILDIENIDEYQQILNEAKLSCDKIASKANTIRTLLNAEIQKLKKGQKGLAGYAALNKEEKTNIQRRI